MGLVNAANMARGHAKLASDEATSAVSEMQEARKEAEESNTKARTAAKISKKLYEDNLALQQQVGHLKKERRTLVKAVRDLQQEQEQTSKFDTWRLLEEHVQNSLTMHEMILKTPTRGTTKKSFFDSAHESTRSVSDEDGSNYISAASVEKPEKPKKFGRISPTPTASCSEDSMSYKHAEGYSTPARSSEDQENVGMPTDVSLVKRRPTSPLGTPIISQEGNDTGSQDLKPICDPNILRTLAIPGDERVGGSDLPSPRVRIAPGLYEV
jgi:polyhydroxyalkanoate synthesis regulator phasin